VIDPYPRDHVTARDPTMRKAVVRGTSSRLRPIHPGEVLFREFLDPLGMTQTELASRLGISFPRVNEIINGRRAVTPDTALRLARLFGTTAELWLGLQQAVDLWDLEHSPETARALKKIEPLRRAG
jgi:addiction module HigA family antidote